MAMELAILTDNVFVMLLTMAAQHVITAVRTTTPIQLAHVRLFNRDYNKILI